MHVGHVHADYGGTVIHTTDGFDPDVPDGVDHAHKGHTIIDYDRTHYYGDDCQPAHDLDQSDTDEADTLVDARRALQQRLAAQLAVDLARNAESRRAQSHREVDALLDEGFHCGQYSPVNAAAHDRVCGPGQHRR